MTLEILTPEKKLYSGEASAVTLPGIDGKFQLLENTLLLSLPLVKVK
jgi:F-type H+-transporting ATPase subunit epsilon